MTMSRLSAWMLVCVFALATASMVRDAAMVGRPQAYWTLQTVLQLRGGVRQLEDRDEWEALLADAGDRLIVVDFTATWCGPCQRIAPAYEKLAEAHEDAALFVKIDVDELGDLAAELGVTSMPTFLFLRDGQVIDTLRGADEEGLRAMIATHI